MLRFYLWLRRSRRTGLIGVALLVALVVFANAACFHLGLSSRFGDRMVCLGNDRLERRARCDLITG
jgi:hypothetical protein